MAELVFNQQVNVEGPSYQETYTLTFGDRAENHKGMQVIGTSAETGFTNEDLMVTRDWFQNHQYPCEIYDLTTLLPVAYQSQAEQAYLLVAPGGLSAIVEPDALYYEQRALVKDTQALMYGRVVNKHARHNLCFADSYQPPNYQAGQGTVLAFQDLPYLDFLRKSWSSIVGPSAANLYGEGNYYHNLQECGIGYHGDAERKKVIAVRLGAPFPLCYQWYYQGSPVGGRGYITLKHGDIYMMSEKAVGSDWKKKNILTLRHAAGAEKYITVP